MRRLWLIAEREFRAYAGAPSFWVALVVGPLLIAVAGLLLVSTGPKPPPAWTVAVRAPGPGLQASAEAALREAAALEHRGVVLASSFAAARSRITIAERDGGVAVAVAGEPLPPIAEALLRRDLARRDGPAAAVTIDQPPLPVAEPMDPRAPGRFALMMLLWVNLVGAMGVLMQTIVRERTNRALEGLLASAKPHEVLFGKLAGVGAVSALVALGWGGGAALLAGAFGAVGNSSLGVIVAALLSGVLEPATLIEAAVIYALTFVMYGAALLGLGATARDLPAAQNLARPVFGLLLIVFFAALASLGSGGGLLQALIWAPPFTPFVLLLTPADAMAPLHRELALALLAAAALLAALVAPRSLEDKPWRRLRLALQR